MTNIGLCLAVIFVCAACHLVAFENWAIVANGSVLPEDQLRQGVEGRRIVALDGAADRLNEFGIHPHVILGDFDSIENTDYWGIQKTFDLLTNEDKSYEGNFGILIVPAKDQNHTDLEKAINYCDQQGAASILVLNAVGKRLDHSLGNIGLMRKYYKVDRRIAIQKENEWVEYIKDGMTLIKGQKGDSCAIMGYPEATMTTTGLMYNGQDYALKMGIQESLCNKLAEEEARVSIKGEALVIHPLSKIP